ncbi:exostosin family protein [Polynucleobacter sp. AP-Titi-500A-B4]|jgi:hypothetical protein|uniref:exostosin domain-containing protein n=1 Tax=Polynucleobacter sp. AP-Titi-500A-B4 TaxID=2576923 RepID=UPI001BFCEE35|nr:exostosin family protein [Polynucleobacter sp. AP-Titi-500A-B4]QWE12634.1 exostosin family protein [Polynucleobacter sp. AP-Titi-500A-B4]
MKSTIIGNAHDLNAAQEIWFIQNILFSGSEINIGYSPNILRDQTVIYLELNEISGELIKQLRLEKNKIVLYHMGDEFGRMSREQYRNCDLVIRNYYFDEIFSSKEDVEVIWAPCGFKTGIGPRESVYIKPASKRQWRSSFFGWLENSASYNGEREGFARIAPECGEDLFLQATSGFAMGWNIGLYSIAMESSVFAPCPAGNAPETIRLYDALELGCIPISLSHDFIISPNALGLIGPAPFPILNSWNELPTFLKSIKEKVSSSPRELDDMQARCIAWWTDYKIAIQRKIAQRIQTL